MGEKVRTAIKETNPVSNSDNSKPIEKQQLSYEELNRIANQMHVRLSETAAELEELRAFVMNKRMDYLFMILGEPGLFSKHVIDKSVREIEISLFKQQYDDVSCKTEVSK